MRYGEGARIGDVKRHDVDRLHTPSGALAYSTPPDDQETPERPASARTVPELRKAWPGNASAGPGFSFPTIGTAGFEPATP